MRKEVLFILIGIVLVSGVSAGVERGFNWDRIEEFNETFRSGDLKIYNSPINYFNGSCYSRFVYGPYGGGFRDNSGLIYRVSSDVNKSYINLYDVDDNYLSSFGFAITGDVGGVFYKYSTLNFSWVWSSENNITTGEYVFRAWNNRTNFNWTQEYYFYPNQSMKIKNVVVNNLGGDANITNTTFWYIQTVNASSGVWFNGTKHNSDVYKKGVFDDLIAKIRFEDNYVFSYDDLLNNSFNITDFYLGDGDVIGAKGIRIMGIGITKNNGFFPNGITVIIDPSVTIGGEGGGDAYVYRGSPNNNYGDDTDLIVKNGSSQLRNSYLIFNISSIPDNQVIDNASLCVYLYNDRQGSLTIGAYHVYENFDEMVITWNNQPCGQEFNNSGSCNLTAESVLTNDGNQDDTWQCWNITNMVGYEYNNDSKNISIALFTDNSSSYADFFYSKEYSNSSLRPYLNISYHAANTAPFINIVRPQEGASYGYNESIELNFTVGDNESNIDSCWYNLDGGSNISLDNCQNTSFNVSGDGSYVVNIFVNDSFNSTGKDGVNFSVQIGAPTIFLYFPIDVYLNYSYIEFNYTPEDIDLESCDLWGDFTGSFGLNQTDYSPSNYSVNSFYLNLSDESYLWNIRCNDSVGNFAFNGNKSFVIDTINPSLVLSEPQGTKTSQTGIVGSWSVFDNNLESCWYSVYRGASPEILDTFVDCNSSVSFDVSGDGNYVFNFYVNDSAGNSDNASSSFSVDTSGPDDPSNGGGGGSSRYTPVDLAGKLEFSEIGNIIAKESEKKILSLNVRNIGKGFLNNCKLLFSGDIKSWFYSTGIKGVSPGENVDFIFDLNVPEGIKARDYFGKLEVRCDENSGKQNISVSVLEGLGIIKIKDISHEREGLNISYFFNNSDFIGRSILVEIWLLDEDDVEVKRIIDDFNAGRGGLIERNVLMKLPEDLVGIYSVNFALSSDLSNVVRQSVVLGKSSTTGMAIADIPRDKIVGYFIFVLILAIGMFFIFRSNRRIEYKEDRVSRKFFRFPFRKQKELSIDEIQITLKK